MVRALSVLGFAAALTLRVASASAEPVRTEIEAPTAVLALETARVSLSLVPTDEHFISRTAPLSVSVRVEPADGLVPTTRRLMRKDAADPSSRAPRFDVVLRATKPGNYRLSLEVRLWVCRGKVCRPMALEPELELSVTEPAPAPGPDPPVK